MQKGEMGHWELLWSIEKALNRAQEKHKNIPSIWCTQMVKLRVYKYVILQ